MTVKGIFKILIGTVAIILMSEIFIEYINVSMSGNAINQYMRISVNRACDYFGQETYKSPGGQNWGNVDGVVGGDPVVTAASGVFYSGGSSSVVYKDLYGSGGSPSAEFGAFLAAHGHNWENARNFMDPSAEFAKYFADNLITPLNMGITYLDRESLEKIAKWNLAKILMNDLPGSVGTNAAGRVYVMRDGFRVYVDSMTIDDIEYTVVDLESDEFREYTNIEGSALATNGDERTMVCLAGVSFSVDVEYAGVTRLGELVQFIYNSNLGSRDSGENRVHGLGNPGAETPMGAQTLIGRYESGGLEGVNTGMRATSGKLIYYIVR